jgi:cytochrome c2
MSPSLKKMSFRLAMLCTVSALIFSAQLKNAWCGDTRSALLKPDPSDGKHVFAQKCEACHFDLSSEKKIGPGLAGLMKRAKFKNGMAADEYHLRRVIDRGGKDMPPFRGLLTEKQIRDLIAYVKTL